MLRRFVLAVLVALGMAGVSLSTTGAQAAMVAPGPAAALAGETAVTPSQVIPAYYYRGGGYYHGGYYRRPYYRPYYHGYYRPYGYYGGYGAYGGYGGCRVVTRRVWGPNGVYFVRRRVCY
jgi:hypothetical protein